MTPSPADLNPRQFLTFRVEDAEYGVDLLAVREIKGWTETTRLPDAANYIRGVINLRGTIIPIADLRLRFGLPATDASARHAVIILAVGTRTIGLLVDGVSDILDVAPGEIKEPPAALSKGEDSSFVCGLIPLENRMVTLLDIPSLFQTGLPPEEQAA